MVLTPSTGDWTSAPPLRQARRLHTLPRLENGGILAVGGIGAGPGVPPVGLATAELYDPAGGWLPVGGFSEGRFSHSATALKDGRLLVTGGCTARDDHILRTLRSAELYDPDSRRWTRVRASMTDARFGHPAVRLEDGRVLLVGGALAVGRGGYTALGHCELFHPGDATWTPTGIQGARGSSRGRRARCPRPSRSRALGPVRIPNAPGWPRPARSGRPRRSPDRPRTSRRSP
ncbi:Kelch repeat-containing protein [Streptomyces sp. NPDC020472]|uniref:Kelch repeat-containing protein n=1 Tax=Streptomyces sp. NPDC020472 TaxID=3365075 RepID=UPI0037B1DDB3